MGRPAPSTGEPRFPSTLPHGADLRLPLEATRCQAHVLSIATSMGPRPAPGAQWVLSKYVVGAGADAQGPQWGGGPRPQGDSHEQQEWAQGQVLPSDPPDVFISWRPSWPGRGTARHLSGVWGLLRGQSTRPSAAEEPRIHQNLPLHPGVRADAAQTAGLDRWPGSCNRAFQWCFVPQAEVGRATGPGGGVSQPGEQALGSGRPQEGEANGDTSAPFRITHLHCPIAFGKGSWPGEARGAWGPRRVGGGLRGPGPHTALPQGTWPWWPLRSGFLMSLEVRCLIWRWSGSPVTSVDSIPFTCSLSDPLPKCDQATV